MKKALVISLLWLLINPLQAQTQLQKGFAQKLLAEKLNPTSMAFDHHGNLFLAQKDGRVLLLKNDETLLEDPVLTLAVDDFNERGINGIALHPDFDKHPWLYLFYTAPQGNFNRISRFRMNGYFAVPGSEQILFEFDPMEGAVHNGGGMAFDAEGYLFAGHGDGGKSSNAQKLDLTLGKIIRLEDDGDIPGDNPFFSTATGKNRAIFAYGLRNPFAMTFQKSAGKILVSDVGAGAAEEVNSIEKGKNYGWNKVEGYLQNGVAPPADYQDPLFAYPHSDGCAIIGAAVYEPENQQFPQNFQSKFFFADYCGGYVKTLDLTTAQPDSLPFATGLKQPVAFATRPDDGSLFYLMRSGIGGGSVVDNTATTDGTLWKIFYTGSGAPTISVDPRPVLVSDGEAASFEIQVLGTPPFQFFWEKNGQVLAGNFSEKLTLPATTLADSGSIFRCIVQNLEGADTSKFAVLQVTANRRPQPQIIFPTQNLQFAAGDTIHFEGFATDFEEGNLPADRLTWRVDFHHDQHSHPVLASTSGVFSRKIAVPLAGETSENVWYRIQLTATDAAGLQQTVARDVHPILTKIRVEADFPLPLNFDGVLRPMPAEFFSLKNQTRNLLVPQILEKNDSIFVFKNWENGDTAALRTISTPDSAAVFRANFELFTRGRGTGLHGEYFLDPEFDLDDLPVFLRLDTLINFNWGDDSPHPTLPGNGYTIRWTGFVQPVFSERYNFHVRSDDGCRLWVGDSLLIDKWQPQAPTENTGSLALVGGKKYPIRLEFLEIGGGAEIALRWSSPRTPKALIPKKQMYPPDPFAPAALSGRVWKDLDYDGLQEASEPPLVGTTVLLFLKKDSSLVSTQVVDNHGKYKFNELSPATYFLRFVPAVTAGNLLAWTNLSALGSTDSLRLAPLQSLVLDAAFVLPPTSIGGVCWHDKNADGQPQTAEPLLENVSVLLFDAADTSLLAVAQTDVFGKYFFNFLRGGEYLLQFVAPPGLAGLSPAGGQISAAGESQILDLQQGENFGLQVPWREATAEIEGRIWLDANHNFFPDLDELGIGQVSVLLFRAADSSLVFARTSAADGRFLMSPLPAGKYFFQFNAGLVGADLLPSVGISAAGFSPVFALKNGQSAQLNFSFVPKISAAGEADFLDGLAVFPNPSAGVFVTPIFRSGNTAPSPDLEVGVTNAAGVRVFPKISVENDWLWLDFGGLPDGFYFLNLIENGRSRTARLLVER